MFSDSAIGKHLLDNPICPKNYSDKKFTVLSFCRLSFYLSALEAVYIKSCKPNQNHASHQIMKALEAVYIKPCKLLKRVCLQLETLALFSISITCCDASLI